jgi:L-threonylcarbamoyladenylate synthase
MEKVSLQELLKLDIRGKVICFPTDTVYGVGALVSDPQSIRRIYEMKKRDARKPLAILTASRDIKQYVKNISQEASELMFKQWPGALTLIFLKSDFINDEITMGFPTVAFRMPDSKVALAILNKFGMMATTSVNVSGEKELNSVEDIASKFGNDIDYIVTDLDTFSYKPSRVIDVTSNEIKIIRN